MAQAGRPPNTPCGVAAHKPRIAIVVPGIESSGGVRVVASFLARAIRESGRYESEFISPAMSRLDASNVRLLAPSTWKRGIISANREWQGNRFIRVGALWSEFEFQRYRPNPLLTELLERYELVHIVAGGPSWALLARDVRRPVALTVATLVSEERRAQLAAERGLERLWHALMTRITSRIEDRALHCVDAVFVMNHWMHDHVRSRLGDSKVTFSPPGIDTDHFHPTAAPKPGPGYIITVGRLADPRKELGLIFEAYQRLISRITPSPRLLLIGAQAPRESDWARATQLGIRDRIEYRKDVLPDELSVLYRNALLFVSASDEEGFGLAILEAMASGLPVVSTDCGGPRATVLDGRSGYLVGRGDADALASRMLEILTNDALRRRMGEQGRARAVKDFSIEVAGEPCLDWYNRTLRNSVGLGSSSR